MWLYLHPWNRYIPKQTDIWTYLRGNIELDPGTYQMVCGPCFTASGDRLSDCQVTSSDPDVVSVKMLGSTDAQITVHKSGSAVLTIQSKYNPDAVETANISVGILDSSHYDMSVSEESFVYDGTEHRPVVKLYKKALHRRSAQIIIQ